MDSEKNKRVFQCEARTYIGPSHFVFIGKPEQCPVPRHLPTAPDQPDVADGADQYSGCDTTQYDYFHVPAKPIQGSAFQTCGHSASTDDCRVAWVPCPNSDAAHWDGSTMPDKSTGSSPFGVAKITVIICPAVKSLASVARCVMTSFLSRIWGTSVVIRVVPVTRGGVCRHRVPGSLEVDGLGIATASRHALTRPIPSRFPLSNEID
jgi:hypothetical protein